jgi:hypothetical protein
MVQLVEARRHDEDIRQCINDLWIRAGADGGRALDIDIEQDIDALVE